MKLKTRALYSYNKNWSRRGSLKTLVEELRRQLSTKVDFISSTADVELHVTTQMDEDGIFDEVWLRSKDDNVMSFWGNENGCSIAMPAIKQLGSLLHPNVKASFTEDLLRVNPKRFCQLFNGLMKDSPRNVLLRSLDGQLRAVLTDRYRMIDNYDIVSVFLSAAQERNAEMLDCTLTPNKMRVRLVSREIWDAIETRRNTGGSWFAGGLGAQEHIARVAATSESMLPGGPGTIWPSVSCHNSETGRGGYSLHIGILQAICFNLAVVEEVARLIHIGKTNEPGIFSQETIRKENELIFSKIKDSVHAAFDKQKFKRIVDIAKGTAEQKIEDALEAAEDLRAKANLTEDERNLIFNHFINDYSSTTYGLAQATSRAAQDMGDPDRSAALERLSGQIIRGRVSVIHREDD